MILNVTYRLQAFPNPIRRTFVQHFTRFQLTACSHGSSVLAELLVNFWHSGALALRAPECQKLKMVGQTSVALNPSNSSSLEQLTLKGLSRPLLLFQYCHMQRVWMLHWYCIVKIWRLYLASSVRTVCSSEEDLAFRHSCWYINCWFDCRRTAALVSCHQSLLLILYFYILPTR